MRPVDYGTLLRWPLVLAIGLGFASCPESKPPGPDTKVLSDKAPVVATAGAGTTWVVARRKTTRSQPSGRGSLPGCTITNHSVELLLVVKVGPRTRRVKFHARHEGDTTKLPRYAVKPGRKGRCVAVRKAGKQDPWRLIRVQPDGTLLHLTGDEVSSDVAGPPCDQAGGLRKALLGVLADGDRAAYLDHKKLIRYVLKRGSDEVLLKAYIAALLDYPQRLSLAYLPKGELPPLRARVCARPSLVLKLREALSKEQRKKSFRHRNIDSLLQGCGRAAPAPRRR